MITLADYLGKWQYSADVNDVVVGNAQNLLAKVNTLLDRYETEGNVLHNNPATGTLVSGDEFGGFRPQECPIGAPKSAHKQGRAVDIYDPRGSLDDWLNDTLLAIYGLYREAPDSTRGWCHLTDRAPGSGRRTFNP